MERSNPSSLRRQRRPRAYTQSLIALVGFAIYVLVLVRNSHVLKEIESRNGPIESSMKGWSPGQPTKLSIPDTPKSPVVETPKCYDKYDWENLPQDVQQAATNIGYTKNIWDEDIDLPGVDKVKWDTFGVEITQALKMLGFRKETWDCGTCGGCPRPNLVFIMTDQQRYDALSIMGNTVLETPNIDRIGNEGVKFDLCYSQCPVCGPARTSIMTGRTIDHTGVPKNPKVSDYFNHTEMPCYDKVLTNVGYEIEYYGKWHAAIEQALTYNNWVTPAGTDGWKHGPGMERQYMDYLNDHVPPDHVSGKKKYDGLQIQSLDKRPYKTNPLDARHGLKADTDKAVHQPDQHGISTIPSDYTLTAFQAKQFINALERMARKKKPFSLHLSFHSPHTPMTPSEPFASMYDPSDMHPPSSISDPMDNSPYKFANKRMRFPEYADPEKIKYMIANYYALIKEIDTWVGKILAKIDQLGLTKNTMIIFTSDHGEMLGSHGMREKNIFYEESARVPLMIRFPGRIKPGTVVLDKPVSHIDLFPTILDYMEAGKHASDGESLRKFIDGSGKDEETFAVSEWNPSEKGVPHFMIRSKRWKFMCPCTADSKVMNALYDLEKDPREMNNLLGNNSDKKRYVAEGEMMKNELVRWLEKVGSPYLAEVKKRKVI